MIRRIGAWAALALATATASAHEVRPGYLQIREGQPGIYQVTWKVPALGEDMRLALNVRMPPQCTAPTAPQGAFVASSYVERWIATCPGGLAGGTILIDGLDGTMTDVLVRLEYANGAAQSARLTPSTPSFVVKAVPGNLEVASAYLSLGVEHILLGIDHLLFVLGLLLLVHGTWRVLATITAFTVAHSITLAAATLGYVHVHTRPVEAVIALSIVFVAAEVLRPRGVAARWPWIVAFAFGLLHGLGFAGALAEVGLPQQAIPLALLFFNVGVELGQIAFICIVFAVAAAVRAGVRRWRAQGGDSHTLQRARRAIAYGIGAMACFWLFERIASLSA